MTGSGMIQFSISVGHSFAHGFALSENGNAVSGAVRVAKGCVSAAYAKMPVVWSGG